MKQTFQKGLRIFLLLAILFINLGSENVHTVYAAAPDNDDFANAKVIDSVTYFDLNVETT